MEIQGNLSEFPLPELLQFIDRRQLTGLLTLEVYSEHYSELKSQTYFIWMSQGQIVAASRGARQQGLLSMLIQQGWMGEYAARKLAKLLPTNIPAGLYLESQGILKFQQLRALFSEKVVHRVQALCKVRTAHFKLETDIELPTGEMTGLSLSASEIALHGFGGHQATKVCSPKKHHAAVISH